MFMYTSELGDGYIDTRGRTIRVVAASLSIGVAILSLYHRATTAETGEASAGAMTPVSSNNTFRGETTTTATYSEIVPDAKTDPQDFIRWAALEYHTRPERALCVAKRESNYQTSVTNTWDSNAQKGLPSRGMFQFVQPTAEYVANHSINVEAWRELGMTYYYNGTEVTNRAAIRANWTDPGVQTLLFLEAQEQGLSSHWSTHNPATEC